MEVVKPSPIDVAKGYMKEQGIKLGCRLPLHVAMRGSDNMFGHKVKRTPLDNNIWDAGRGTSSGPHPNQHVVGFPILGEVKVNKSAYVYSFITLSRSKDVLVEPKFTMSKITHIRSPTMSKLNNMRSPIMDYSSAHYSLPSHKSNKLKLCQ